MNPGAHLNLLFILVVQIFVHIE
jgi:hypothetical protein